MARTPPMPRTSSWWRRISRPRTYRMLVIGRSASAFSGMSVSSSRTGTRPTWATQTASEQLAARQLDRHGQRQARRVLDPPERQARQVVVGVVVLLVPVGVDRLAEVALAIEETDADRRQGHVAGRLHVVAGEDARGRPSRCRAIRGSRTRRRSRRSGPSGDPRTCAGTSGRSRWPCRRRSRPGRRGTRPGTWRRRGGATTRSRR